MDKTNNLKDFFKDLADGIRFKLNSEETIKPIDMPSVIENINPEDYCLIEEELIDSSGNGLNIIENLFINSSRGISYRSYYGLRSLKSVYINEEVKTIDSDAFAGCSQLNEVVIPETVLIVYKSSFSGTPWYNNLTDDVIYIGKCLHSLKKTEIPNGEFAVKDGTYSISDLCFSNNNTLQTITIPNSVTFIGSSAFSKSTLKYLILPEKIQDINNGICKECINLTEVIFLGNISRLYSEAFRDCNNVLKYDFSNNNIVPVLESSNVFEGMGDDCQIIVPEGLLEKWKSAKNWSVYDKHIIAKTE